MADTDAPTEPVEAATAPAPAPVEDEATPGGDVNTGPSENLREVSEASALYERRFGGMSALYYLLVDSH
jgi:hypothetical protein